MLELVLLFRWLDIMTLKFCCHSQLQENSPANVRPGNNARKRVSQFCIVNVLFLQSQSQYRISNEGGDLIKLVQYGIHSWILSKRLLELSGFIKARNFLTARFANFVFHKNNESGKEKIMSRNMLVLWCNREYNTCTTVLSNVKFN